ncbi:MAG: DM13 domain-containing protein [Cyanophyceae cyanobacterium]
MNPRQLFRPGIASSVVVLAALVGAAASFESVSQAQPNETVIELAQSAAEEIMEGTFVAAEAPTTGNVSIVNENGTRYLVIDSAFSTTDQAPDLHVLLDTVEQPPQQYTEAEAGRYINLGGLQNTMGEQRYPIPNAVELSQIKSVVVWCRMANATMGYATLNESATASVPQ